MSMIRRRAQAGAARSRGGATAQETTLPLPLRGLFSQAKAARVNVQYAGEVVNWRSTGVLLQTRPAFSYASEASDILQRVPYEFGPQAFYLGLGATRMTANGRQAPRGSNGAANVAYISANALIADGTDRPIRFDGGEWKWCNFTTTTEARESDFDGIIAHHDRPFLWKTNGDLEFYFGEVGGVTGALQVFPFGRLGNITGTLRAMATFTLDAGHGINDVLGIFTSTGDVVVYEGLNPGDSDDWRLSARLNVAPPLSQRCMTQVGSDMWFLTAKGIVSTLASISQGGLALANAVSAPIREEILDAVEAGGDWQLHTSADRSMVIVNRVLAGVSEQWIYDTATQTWFKADLPATGWHNLGGVTEFTTAEGRRGTLVRAPGQGAAMTAVLHTGWFEAPMAGLTSFTPTILAKGPLVVRVAVLTDHNATAADLAEAWQEFRVDPEEAGDGSESIALAEEFVVDAVGSVYQIRMEVTASWAQLVGMKIAGH